MAESNNIQNSDDSQGDSEDLVNQLEGLNLDKSGSKCDDLLEILSSSSESESSSHHHYQEPPNQVPTWIIENIHKESLTTQQKEELKCFLGEYGNISTASEGQTSTEACTHKRKSAQTNAATVYSKIGKIEISKCVIDRVLIPTAWLDDESINSWLSLLQRRIGESIKIFRHDAGDYLHSG